MRLSTVMPRTPWDVHSLLTGVAADVVNENAVIDAEAMTDTNEVLDMKAVSATKAPGPHELEVR